MTLVKELRAISKRPRVWAWCFWTGLVECRFDVGLTWPDDQDRNEWYDQGRAFGRALLMLDRL